MSLPAVFPDELFTVKGSPGDVRATAKQFRSRAQAMRDAAGAMRRAEPQAWLGNEKQAWTRINRSTAEALDAQAPKYEGAARALDYFADTLARNGRAMVKERRSALIAFEAAHAKRRSAQDAAVKVAADAVSGNVVSVIADADASARATAAAEAAVVEWESHVATAQDIRDGVEAAARTCERDFLDLGLPPQRPSDATGTCGPGDPASGPLLLADYAIREQAKQSSQGQVGDCYFLGPLRSLAAQDPAFIREHMRFDPCTGHYQVSLFHAQMYTEEWRWIDVDPTQLVNNGVHSGTGAPDVLSIYEKAYSIEKGGDDEISHGGFDGPAMRTLTGKPADVSLLGGPSLDDLDRVVNHKHGIASVGTIPAGTTIAGVDLPFPNGPQGDPLEIPEGKRLVPQHVYQVQAVDPQKRTVTLSNPWGQAGGYNDVSNRWSGEEHKRIWFPGTVTLTEQEYNDWISDGSTVDELR